MNIVSRRAVWIVGAAALWSCGGSVTGVDRPAGGVAAIAVAPSSVTLVVGSDAPLQATVRDEAGQVMPGTAVVWSVKDSSIARVSAAGVVSARGVGNTQVAASAGGLSAIATVAVQQAPVASVVVQPLTQALLIGQTATFTATPRDANGIPLAGRVVTWSSSNDAVASVSQSGGVTALAAGTATITAVSEGSSGSATVTVSPVPVASVSVQPTSAALVVGATVALTAMAKDSAGSALDRPITWSSDQPSIASVGSTGVVSALAAGSATITATSEGKTASAAITVSPTPIASLTVTPPAATVQVGATVTLAATAKDAHGSPLLGRAVSWSSSDEKVATVTPAGVVAGVAVGAATIIATSEGKSATAAITVVSVPVGSVNVLPTSATVTRGQTVALTVTVKDAHGAVVTDRVVTWTSSRNDVATVSTAGVVTGIAAGTARVAATSEGVADSSMITVVNPPIASVTVQPSPASVQVGATVALTATVVDASGAVVSGATVAWSSSNVTLATVSTSGMVTGRAVGSATITATSGGKSGSSTVAVTPVPVSRVSLVPDSVLLAPGATATLTASTFAADGTVLTGRTITYTTDNAGVAKVSSAGVVTGVAAGNAVITATSEGKSATAKVVVQVPVASVTVTPSSISLRRHGTVQLSAVAHDAAGNVLTGRDFTWTSSDSGVAAVDTSGFVTTNKTGTATITVTVEGRSDTSRITVTD